VLRFDLDDSLVRVGFWSWERHVGRI
jgi:hypothetical protein